VSGYPIPRDVTTPCAANPDLMFPDRKSAPARTKAAKKVCAGCPFQAGCLEWAVTRGELGVWAGTDEDERAAMRKARGIVASPIPLLLPRAPINRKVPHGTPVGVEFHRRHYMPLCDVCREFDDKRKRRAS
jgi:WhiB family redox-sensing transcriptional regulator